MKRRVSLLAAVLLATLAAAQQPQVSNDAKFHWEGAIAAGKSLEVRGMNGKIEAVGAEGNRATIDAEKIAREGGDLNTWKIVLVEDAEGVLACAVRTGDEDRCSRTPSGEHRRNMDWDDRHSRVNISFTVRVPRGVKFVGKTVNGGISAERLASVAVLKTTNGPIDVETTEYVSAKTTNGKISATMGRADWTGELEFKTTNGSVDVRLPGSAEFEVTAATTNGSISTDFPVTTQGEIKRTKINGRVGQGGRAVVAKTTNGSVRLAKNGM